MPDTVNFADRFAPPEPVAQTTSFSDRFDPPPTATSTDSGTTNFSDKFEAPKMVELSSGEGDDFANKVQQGNHYTASLVPMTPEFADKMDKPVIPEEWVKKVQPYQQRMVNAALAGGPINIPGAIYAFAKKPDPNSVSAGLVQSGDEAVRSLVTPANAIITAATGGLSAEGSVAAKIITKLVSLGFGAKMASTLPDQARKAVDILEDPKSTPADKAKVLADPAITAILAGSTTIHGLSPLESNAVAADKTPPELINPETLPKEQAPSIPEPTGKPLPTDVKVTPIINDQTGELYGHQIDIPNPENPEGRPIFSGSAEDAAKAGYHVDFEKKYEIPPSTPELDSAISDYHRYQEIQKRITEITKSGPNFDGPEFQALWKESEEIKNRNPIAPGMPPSNAEGQPPLDFSAEGLQKMADESEKIPPEEPSPAEAPEKEAPENYGIAARVSAARSEAGHIEPIEPGEGISSQEAMQHGRDLLASGRDPLQVAADFKETGKSSPDDIALVRAYGEKLYNDAQAASDKFGIDSPEYLAARKTDSDWQQNVVRPMRTSWHAQGQAMQGETEIDYGAFHGLSRAYREATGKEFSAEQAKQAQEISSGIKQVRAEVAPAEQALFDFMEKMPRSFKNADVKQVWSLAKEYLQKGGMRFDDIRHQIATDLGKPVDEITNMLTKPKGAKPLADDLWAKLSKQRQLVSAAKNWIDNQKLPGWQRMASAVPRALFRLATFGHGTVWVGTHTAPEIFKPQDWGQLWPNYFKAFKLMGLHDGGAYHERMMTDLERNPNYITARRAGLENDPSRRVDDYQKAWLGGWFSKLGFAGNRGFDGLKLLRQDLFDKQWNELPESMKTKDMAAMMADAINHSTGATIIRFPQWMQSTFFAPRLEASRWQWLLQDPAKAAKILTPSYWKTATDAEKAFAIKQVKEKATIAGVYLSLLAANQGLLSATGSKQSINFDDPTHSDFLQFKGDGFKFGVGTPFLGIVRLLTSLVNSARGHPANYQKRESTADQMTSAVAQYTRGKLSPFGQVAADVVTGSDYQGRPLPFSNAKVPPSLHKQGIYTRYSYPEYFSEKFMPIPVSDAIQEVWKHQGMDESTMHHWMGAIMSGAVSGLTGTRLSPDTHPSGNK